MTEGVFPKTDGEILYASEVNKMYNIGSGTVTLTADTTSYDVCYGDISVAAGKLAAGDILKIDFVGENDSTSDNIRMSVNINNTSSDGAIIDTGTGGFNAGDKMWGEIAIWQSPVTSDLAVGCMKWTYETSTAKYYGSRDTNDANIFTTAFTIRLNFKYDGTAGSEASKFRYVAYILPA